MKKKIILLSLVCAMTVNFAQATVLQSLCAHTIEKLLPWIYGIYAAKNEKSFGEVVVPAVNGSLVTLNATINKEALFDIGNYNKQQLVHGFSAPLAVSYIFEKITPRNSARFIHPRTPLTFAASMAAIYGWDKIK